MADNINANSGDGLGAKFRTDDDGTQHWPYMKLAFGADNTYTICANSLASRIPTSLGDLAGTALAVGAGVDGAGVQRVVLANNEGLPPGTNNIGDVDIVSGTLTTVTTVGTVSTLTAATSIDNRLGEVQATPTANTVLSRLKTIGDGQLADGHNVTVDNANIAVTQSGAWNITNVSGTISLPTGAASAANQSTIIGHVDGIEASLTTIAGNQLADGHSVVVSSGTVTTVSTVTNLSQLGGQAVTMGTGVRDAGTQRVTIATNDIVPASQSGTWNVENTGTFVVQADLGANNDVQGTGAHGAAVSGNPFTISGVSTTTEGPAGVDSGDSVRVMADQYGKMVNSPYAPIDWHWQATGNKTDTSNLTLKGAAGASIKNYLTDFVASNLSATSVEAIILDGVTELCRFPVPAGGGVVHTFGIPLSGTANTILYGKSSTGVTTLYMTASGFTGR